MREPKIPADIQARLDVIEREAAITSCDVQKPSRLAFMLSVKLSTSTTIQQKWNRKQLQA